MFWMIALAVVAGGVFLRYVEHTKIGAAISWTVAAGVVLTVALLLSAGFALLATALRVR